MKKVKAGQNKPRRWKLGTPQGVNQFYLPFFVRKEEKEEEISEKVKRTISTSIQPRCAQYLKSDGNVQQSATPSIT